MKGSEKRYELTVEDLSDICTIAEERFNNQNYIYGMSLKFSITMVSRFAGGKVALRLDGKKGIIEGAALFGDFFAS